MDETFHQKYAARINFIEMDPSLALVTYKAFRDLTQTLTALLLFCSVFYAKPKPSLPNYASAFKATLSMLAFNHFLK